MGVFDRLSEFAGGGSEPEPDVDEEEPPEDTGEPPADAEEPPASPAEFRDRAEDLSGRSYVPTLDFTAASAANLDRLVAGRAGSGEDPHTLGSYAGEVLVRSYDGSWVEEDDWKVEVELEADSTTIAVFDAARMALDSGPLFEELLDRLEAEGATVTTTDPPQHREVDGDDRGRTIKPPPTEDRGRTIEPPPTEERERSPSGGSDRTGSSDGPTPPDYLQRATTVGEDPTDPPGESSVESAEVDDETDDEATAAEDVGEPQSPMDADGEGPETDASGSAETDADWLPEDPAGETDDADDVGADLFEAEEDTGGTTGDGFTDLSTSSGSMPPREELDHAAQVFVTAWPEYDFDFTPASLVRLDEFVAAEVGGSVAEQSPEPGDGADRLAKVGAYYGRVLIEHLDGEWVPTEDGEGAIEVAQGAHEVPVFEVTRECMLEEGSFAYRFAALASRLDVEVEARSTRGVFEPAAGTRDSTEVIPTVLDCAEAFAEDSPAADLDFSPTSLSRVDDLVAESFAEEDLSDVDLDDPTDPLALRATEQVRTTAAYYAAVLVNHLDANWEIDGDVALVVSGADGSMTIDPVDVATGVLRGTITFDMHFERLTNSVGIDVSG